MQLTIPRASRRRIATSLAAATCSLLGVSRGAVVAAEDAGRWQFDTAVLYYGEQGRVRDGSANVLIRRTFGGARKLSVKLGIDALPGASASGATPATSPQTFTSPSGAASYQTDAGQMPLDPTFHDTRAAAEVGWSQPLGQSFGANVGISLSSEFDYFHAGVEGGLSRDFNGKNTTLSLAASLGFDTVRPVGGVPVGLAAMQPAGFALERAPDDSKDVADLLLGVTQVLGPRTVGQLNYSFSSSSGYLTDPYKIVSVIDPDSGDPVAGPGTLFLYLYESRPDTRTKHGLWAQVRHDFGRDILDAAYRFTTDDWGVSSHTLDLHYRARLGSGYVEPHARLYTQTAADFYVRNLYDGDPFPRHASADYRLGQLDTATLGLKYGRHYRRDAEWNVRVELYSQVGRSPPGGQVVGTLAGFDLYPTVTAAIVQLGFHY